MVAEIHTPYDDKEQFIIMPLFPLELLVVCLLYIPTKKHHQCWDESLSPVRRQTVVLLCSLVQAFVWVIFKKVLRAG